MEKTLVRVLNINGQRATSTAVGQTVELNKRHAKQLEAQGVVEILSNVPDSLPVNKPGKEKVIQPKKEVEVKSTTFFGKPSYRKNIGLKVAWVQDLEKRGGAELSNETIIRLGERIGHNITVVTPQSFKIGVIASADVIIINNFFLFQEKDLQQLKWALFEEKIPYVRYEHDHREITGDTIRKLNNKPFLGYARQLFDQSILNIMISPLQYAEFGKVLGPDFLEHPYYIMATGVDPEDFKEPESPPKEGTLVSMTGNLIPRKGLMEIHAFAKSYPNLKFTVFSKMWAQLEDLICALPNVELKQPASYSDLSRIYGQHEYVVHLPQHFEDSGRTPIEGALCGCKVISNKHTGIMHDPCWEKFGTAEWNENGRVQASITNRDGLIDYIRCNQMGFWREVENRL